MSNLIQYFNYNVVHAGNAWVPVGVVLFLCTICVIGNVADNIYHHEVMGYICGWILLGSIVIFVLSLMTTGLSAKPMASWSQDHSSYLGHKLDVRYVDSKTTTIKSKDIANIDYLNKTVSFIDNHGTYHQQSLPSTIVYKQTTSAKSPMVEYKTVTYRTAVTKSRLSHYTSDFSDEQDESNTRPVTTYRNHKLFEIKQVIIYLSKSEYNKHVN